MPRRKGPPEHHRQRTNEIRKEQLLEELRNAEVGVAQKVGSG